MPAVKEKVQKYMLKAFTGRGAQSPSWATVEMYVLQIIPGRAGVGF